jgi:hypothetical protein
MLGFDGLQVQAAVCEVAIKANSSGLARRAHDRFIKANFITNMAAAL